jgi:hypothetical protein
MQSTAVYVTGSEFDVPYLTTTFGCEAGPKFNPVIVTVPPPSVEESAAVEMLVMVGLA